VDLLILHARLGVDGEEEFPAAVGIHRVGDDEILPWLHFAQIHHFSVVRIIALD